MSEGERGRREGKGGDGSGFLLGLAGFPGLFPQGDGSPRGLWAEEGRTCLKGSQAPSGGCSGRTAREAGALPLAWDQSSGNIAGPGQP